MCIVIATGHPQKTYLDPEEGFGSNEKCIKKVKLQGTSTNLGRILCKSSFSPNNSNSGVKNWSKSFICCQYIKEYIVDTFKFVTKKFKIIPFNYESKNLIYVVNCSGCKEENIGQIQTMLIERLNTSR